MDVLNRDHVFVCRKNEDNACYCVDGFKCLRSGVLNMAPCKRTPELPTGAPLALSYPHFYQADPHYLNVSGGHNQTWKKPVYLEIFLIRTLLFLTAGFTALDN